MIIFDLKYPVEIVSIVLRQLRKENLKMSQNGIFKFYNNAIYKINHK